MSESPKDGKPDSDKRLELAYEAAQALLRVQDTTLGNIRSRANNLLATSALLISFSSGIGLINTDPSKGTVLPESAAWALLILTVFVGVCVLNVLWPAKDWDFGADAKKIMEQRNAGKSEDAIREHTTNNLIVGIDDNDAALRKKQWAFRLAALAFLVEIVVLLVTLILVI